ncbi:ComF family protein [uncultured Serinicoccus sp.]|uniref:ComF family protein n=1 Tax=uncultured Serinicoccus sp. TaxID=735514 RepID=UPI00260A75BB|nr:phosphoribosyltransferase family protein [uncultured Serinicoccus sp.]
MPDALGIGVDSRTSGPGVRSWGMPWRPGEDLRALLELVAPAGCAGCGRSGHRLCPDCLGQLHATGPRPWRPTPCPPGFPPTWSGPAYQGVLPALVVAWKEQDRVDLTGALGDVLRGAVAAAVAGSPEHRDALRAGRPVAVLPAPSAAASTRSRGRCPVRELAVVAAGTRRAVVPALVLTRAVADQAGLSAGQRAANLGGAVRVRPGLVGALAGVPCVVVDDVVTTGATLAECARALRQAGAGRVVAATVAATARRGRADSEPALSRTGEPD